MLYKFTTQLLLLILLLPSERAAASAPLDTGVKYDIGYYPKGILPISVFLTTPTSSIVTLTEAGGHSRWVPGLLTLISLPLLFSGPPGAANRTKSYNLLKKKEGDNFNIERVDSISRKDRIKYLFSVEKRKQNYQLLAFGITINSLSAISAKTEKARTVSWIGAGIVLAAFFVDTTKYFWLTPPKGLSLMPVIDSQHESYGLNLSYTF